MPVGAGEVSVERAELTFASFQQQRQVTGLQTLATGRAEQCQAAATNLLVKGWQVILTKGAGQYMEATPDSMASC